MTVSVDDAMIGNMMYGDWALSPHQRAQKRNLTNQAGQVAPLQKQLNSLSTRLEYAQEDAFLEKIRAEATNTVLKLALEALQKANPASPLLNEEFRKNVKRQRLAELCQANGYVFHADTGKVDLKFRRS